MTRDVLDDLNRQLKHRGPDAAGTWISPSGRAGLAQTRLAIIDLSPTGSQPMHSADGRYHLVFNGEIYNYVELREQLEAEGYVFRGTSDTEVLLHMLASVGPSCLESLDGMFAFGFYDSEQGTLLCARDCLGEKPLYYTQSNNQFAFASEARALVRAGLASNEPCLEGIGFLLRQGSIPPPYTHLRDVRFLEPAHWLQVGPDGHIEIQRRYWKLSFTPEREAISDRQAAMELVRNSLNTSVRRRARADVPVAAFLSGGVDSAAICAFLVQAGVSQLQTFTVTLPGQPLDESKEARLTANRLGTRHVEVPLEVDARGDWLEAAISAMDVPSTDGPNTWLVSRAVANAGVKVACSGVGGDELFFGYPSFRVVPSVYRFARLLAPLALVYPQTRTILSRLPNLPKISRIFDAAFAGGSIAAIWFGKRGLLSESAIRELLTESAFTFLKRVDPFARLESLGCPTNIHPLRQVSFYELSVYMHDQLLRDTDCMSMAHSLEVRLPLIAKPLVETVSSISAVVLSEGGPKGLLREIIRPMIPETIVAGSKRGFTLNWPNLLQSRHHLLEACLPTFLRRDNYEKLVGSPIAVGAVPPSFVIDALGKNLSRLMHDAQ